MPSVSLSLYKIRVRDAYSSEFLQLDAFSNAADLHTIIGDYLSERSGDYARDDENQLLFRVTDLQTPGRSYKGFLEKGDYGYATQIIDAENLVTAYTKRTSDAEMFPFYFYIALPQNGQQGLLAIERFAQRGAKTHLQWDVTRYFKARFPEHMLDLDPYIPAQLLNAYLERGEIKTLRFIRHGVHSDIADFIRNSHELGEGITEIQVRAKRDRNFPIRGYVEQVLNGERPLSSFANFRNFDFTTVKIQIDVMGTMRTIDLSQPDTLNAELDVTEEIEFGEDGLPAFHSLDQVAREYIREGLNRMGINDYDVQ